MFPSLGGKQRPIWDRSHYCFQCLINPTMVTIAIYSVMHTPRSHYYLLHPSSFQGSHLICQHSLVIFFPIHFRHDRYWTGSSYRGRELRDVCRDCRILSRRAMLVVHHCGCHIIQTVPWQSIDVAICTTDNCMSHGSSFDNKNVWLEKSFCRISIKPVV